MFIFAKNNSKFLPIKNLFENDCGVIFTHQNVDVIFSDLNNLMIEFL